MRVQKRFPKNFGDRWLGCKGGDLKKPFEEEIIRDQPITKTEEIKGTQKTEEDGSYIAHSTDSSQTGHDSKSSHIVSNIQSLLVVVSLAVLLTH